MMNHFYDDKIMFKLSQKKHNYFTYLASLTRVPSISSKVLKWCQLISDSESLSCVIIFWLTVLVFTNVSTAPKINTICEHYETISNMVSLTKSVTPLPPQSENTLHRSLLKNVFYFLIFFTKFMNTTLNPFTEPTSKIVQFMKKHYKKNKKTVESLK